MEVSEKEFLEFAADVLDVPVGEINMDTAYQTIPQWDSIKHIRLVMELTAAFGAEITLENAANLKTLRDFHNLCRGSARL